MGGRKADMLRERLEQDIVTGLLAPGARLDEVRLAERFAVSRTPIREAFQHLAAAGLVDLVPRRGAFVRERGIAEIVEMFEVMGELEGMCGRLAARRILPRRAARLERAMRACETMVGRGDTDAYYYANEEFHQAIYDAAHNAYLARQARQLQSALSPYRRLQLRVSDRMRQSLAEHRRIVKAILGGDGVRAEAALKGHVVIQGERFNDLLASLQLAAAE
jgi:DNA-binding GntR family transcriptional regulator